MKKAKGTTKAKITAHKTPPPAPDAAALVEVENRIRQENAAADARMHLPVPSAPLSVKLQWILETADILPAVFTRWLREDTSYRQLLEYARLQGTRRPSLNSAHAP